MNRGCVTGAYLSVHTPRYCTGNYVLSLTAR
jgi:hypothetical protein